MGKQCGMCGRSDAMAVCVWVNSARNVRSVGRDGGLCVGKQLCNVRSVGRDGGLCVGKQLCNVRSVGRDGGLCVGKQLCNVRSVGRDGASVVSANHRVCPVGRTRSAVPWRVVSVKRTRYVCG